MTPAEIPADEVPPGYWEQLMEEMKKWKPVPESDSPGPEPLI